MTFSLITQQSNTQQNDTQVYYLQWSLKILNLLKSVLNIRNGKINITVIVQNAQMI